MLKRIVFVVFIALIAVACSSKKDEETSTLNLKFTNVKGNIKLQALRDQSWFSIDTLTNLANPVEVKVTEEDFYRLMDDNNHSCIVILKPNSTVTIEGNFNDLLSTLKSSDSKVNEDYFVFNRSYAALRAPEEFCVQQYRNYSEVNKNEDSATYYLTKIKVMQDESDKLVKTTIDKIFPSFAIYGILNYLRIEQEFDYISKLAVRIKNEMPDGKYARLFVQEIGRMQTYKDQQAQKDAAGNVVVGKAAPEFSANTPEGEKVSLSDFKGKYVLVDFWASWCGPCRAESPNMVKLYQDFKGSQFEIIGVSLDNEKTAWTKAIEKDHYTWVQISDLLQWDSPIARLYQIDGIPATVLIDPNGVVVAKNLRGEELYNKIKTLLHD